jgi:hypothetical protein
LILRLDVPLAESRDLIILYTAGPVKNLFFPSYPRALMKRITPPAMRAIPMMTCPINPALPNRRRATRGPAKHRDQNRLELLLRLSQRTLHEPD